MLIGEVCYEGIQEASRQEVQRFMFWSALLSGTGGHTYGANGIWQVNTREKPYGLSPHGHSWGGPAWDIAAAAARFGPVGNRQGASDALLVVETGAAARTDRSALDQGGLLEAICRADSRRGGHRVYARSALGS